MGKKRRLITWTDKETSKAVEEIYRHTKPVRKVNLTPEEEEHWAQVRQRIAEAREKGEL